MQGPGIPSIDLTNIEALILDIDGVLYEGNRALPGAVELLAHLVQNETPHVLLTNNTTRTLDQHVVKLAALGMPISPESIVTAARVTALVLAGEAAAGARCMVIGEAGLVEALELAGFQLTLNGYSDVDYVVVGMDRKFTYAKLHEAQQAILAGATFIATNRDATYPIEGNVIPGGGSIVAAVATAAEKEPLLIGKPSAEAGKLITHAAGVEPHEALMVGDRLETDIEMGRRAGLLTCLVLTGISTRQEAEALPPESQPHWIVDTIQQIPDILEGRVALNEGAR